MGVVFSCLASVCLWTGELLENLFLVVGEVGSILVRGIFSLLVGLCDVLAAASCCCNVPWNERPSRQHYTYSTLSLNVGGQRALHGLSGEGKAAKQQEKEAARTEDQLRLGALKLQRQEAAAAKKAAVAEKKAQKTAPSTDVDAPNDSTDLKSDEVAPTAAQVKAAKKAEVAAKKAEVAAKKAEATAAKLANKEAAKQAKLAASAPAAAAPAAVEAPVAEPVAAAPATSTSWFSGLFGGAAPATAAKAE